MFRSATHGAGHSRRESMVSLLAPLAALLVLGAFLSACSDGPDENEAVAPNNDAEEPAAWTRGAGGSGSVSFNEAVAGTPTSSLGDEDAKVSFEYPTQWRHKPVWNTEFWQYPLQFETGEVIVTVYRARGMTARAALDEHKAILEARYDIQDVQVPLAFANRDPDFIGGPLPTSTEQELRFPYDLVFGTRYFRIAGKTRIGAYGEFAQHNHRYMAFVEAFSGTERTVAISYVFEQSQFPTLKYALGEFRNSFRLIEPPPPPSSN